MSTFEIIMLVCFGAAWPFSIWKGYVTKRNGGKSLLFLLIILAGYIAGILHKIFYYPDNVIYLYILNCLMVTIDILIFFRNKHFETI